VPRPLAVWQWQCSGAGARQADDKHRFYNLLVQNFRVSLQILGDLQVSTQPGVNRHLCAKSAEIVQAGFRIQCLYQALKGLAEVIAAKIRQTGFFLCRFYQLLCIEH